VLFTVSHTILQLSYKIQLRISASSASDAEGV
jgi:hypothetical protein